MPKKISKEEFIERANEIHNHKYDYSLIDYKNTTTNIIIVCPIHGEFEQLPYLHLKGRGCQKCGGSKQMTQEEFIKRSKEIHGNKYDYSLVKYRNSQTKVTLICPIHGEFETVPSKHLHRNFGCPKCGIEKRSTSRKNDVQDVINTFKEIHGNKYDYSKFEYINFYTPSTIICNKHGEFQQNTYNHSKGHGCPKCGNLISDKEEEIKLFIKNLGYSVTENSRKIIPPKEVDIFIPEKNIAIEYDGLYWHSEKMINKSNRDGKAYHINKLLSAAENNIRLIQIFEDEYIYKKEIVLNRIKHILGVYERKIGGRQVLIKEIDNKTKNLFLNSYHIQGQDASSIKLGAFYKNELISVMTFGKKRIALGNKNIKENEYELLRFATKFGVLGQGIASKLLSHFIKNYDVSNVITYSDKRWNTGNLYKQLGFEYSHTSAPNYWYIEKNKRIHRFNFRKQELKNKLKTFNSELTEYENMQINGYDRIWDCGNDVWVYNK
jgi:DNA-directed RNA polymerase subunit M/transcription elongation factor TFIIS